MINAYKANNIIEFEVNNKRVLRENISLPYSFPEKKVLTDSQIKIWVNSHFFEVKTNNLNEIVLKIYPKLLGGGQLFVKRLDGKTITVEVKDLGSKKSVFSFLENDIIEKLERRDFKLVYKNFDDNSSKVLDKDQTFYELKIKNQQIFQLVGGSFTTKPASEHPAPTPASNKGRNALLFCMSAILLSVGIKYRTSIKGFIWKVEQIKKPEVKA